MICHFKNYIRYLINYQNNDFPPEINSIYIEKINLIQQFTWELPKKYLFKASNFKLNRTN